jgi:hypothetical protein
MPPTINMDSQIIHTVEKGFFLNDLNNLAAAIIGNMRMEKSSSLASGILNVIISNKNAMT